jgi:hypothetical protein
MRGSLAKDIWTLPVAKRVKPLKSNLSGQRTRGARATDTCASQLRQETLKGRATPQEAGSVR